MASAATAPEKRCLSATQEKQGFSNKNRARWPAQPPPVGPNNREEVLVSETKSTNSPISSGRRQLMIGSGVLGAAAAVNPGMAFAHWGRDKERAVGAATIHRRTWNPLTGP